MKLYFTTDGMRSGKLSAQPVDVMGERRVELKTHHGTVRLCPDDAAALRDFLCELVVTETMVINSVNPRPVQSRMSATV